LSALARPTKLVAASDQVSSELAGESVILNLKTGLYYGLNEVGARIWDLLQTPTTFGNICDAIEQEYAVDTHRCEQDVRVLLEELITAQLVMVQG
jgi:hypothetical protein